MKKAKATVKAIKCKLPMAVITGQMHAIGTGTVTVHEVGVYQKTIPLTRIEFERSAMMLAFDLKNEDEPDIIVTKMEVIIGKYHRVENIWGGALIHKDETGTFRVGMKGKSYPTIMGFEKSK